MIVEFLFLISFTALMGLCYAVSLLEEQQAIEIHETYRRFHEGGAK